MIDGAAAVTGSSSRSRASSSTRRCSRTTPSRIRTTTWSCSRTWPRLRDVQTFVLVDQIRVNDELVDSFDRTRPRPRREAPRSLLLRGRALPLPILGLLARPPRLGQVGGGGGDEAGARRRTSRRSRVRDDGPRAWCGRSSTRRRWWPRTSSTPAREPRRARLRSRLRSRLRHLGRSGCHGHGRRFGVPSRPPGLSRSAGLRG